MGWRPEAFVVNVLQEVCDTAVLDTTSSCDKQIINEPWIAQPLTSARVVALWKGWSLQASSRKKRAEDHWPESSCWPRSIQLMLDCHGESFCSSTGCRGPLHPYSHRTRMTGEFSCLVTMWRWILFFCTPNARSSGRDQGHRLYFPPK